MHELFPELGLGRVVLQERKNVVRERTRLGVASEDKRTEGRISGCDSRGATCSVRATDIGSRVLMSHDLRSFAVAGSYGIVGLQVGGWKVRPDGGGGGQK